MVFERKSVRIGPVSKLFKTEHYSRQLTKAWRKVSPYVRSGYVLQYELGQVKVLLT